jgi:hypothetical protein
VTPSGGSGGNPPSGEIVDSVELFPGYVGFFGLFIATQAS